jgi:hypothetical protein
MTDDEDDDDKQVEVELDDDDTEQDAEKPEQEGEDGEETTGDNDDDEMVVEVEGLEEPAVEETPVIRSLRHRERELARRVKELEAQQKTAAVEELGPKPDLWEDCDGDTDVYDAAKSAWDARKTAIDNRRAEAQAAEQRTRERFDTSLAVMRANAAKLGVPGYQEAEEAVGSALPPVLGNAIPMYFGERAPALVKALHAHPALLEKITTAAKADPVQALFDLWDLSKGVKMVAKRKSGAKAEEILRGSAPLSTVPDDKQKARLEKAVDDGKPGAQEAYMAFLKAKRDKVRAA